MKKQEIKKLSKDEMIKNIDKLKKDLFNFRFQKMNSQVTNLLIVFVFIGNLADAL